MYNFNILKDLKDSNPDNNQLKEKKYEIALEKALESLSLFNKNPISGKEQLKLAGENLIEALKLKRTKAEPYIFLSYIFYVTGDTAKAAKYLNNAKSLEPNHKRIPEMSRLIEQSNSISKKIIPINHNDLKTRNKLIVNPLNIKKS